MWHEDAEIAEDLEQLESLEPADYGLNGELLLELKSALVAVSRVGES
jgi:hypothetical protein